jgi:hypothetical protein
MRSTWSVESILAFLAAASVEAAVLTLAYLAVNWLSGNLEIHLGIASFAVVVALGLVLARWLRRAAWERYLVVVPAAAVLVGIGGIWLTEVAAGAPADPVALVRNAGGWLLGIGVLRGTAHAELDDERFTIERLNRFAMPGLVAFWIVAAATGLARDPGYTAAAFGATLTFVSSALFGLGLARLGELQVESIDQAARRRWLALLVGVSALLLLVGLPLAGLLQVPLATAAAGAAGPLATVIIVLFTVLATPILLVAQAVLDLLGHIDFHFDVLPPQTTTGGGGGSGSPIDLIALMSVVLAVAIVFDLVVILVIVAAILRRRRRRRRLPGPELREPEPIVPESLATLLRLPRLPRWRPWAGAPTDAVDAYRLALVALAGRDEGRRSGETPREHASRIRRTAIGGAVGRLAADYQLAALAGRRLSEAEERRARSRWQRIRRWVR